MRRVFRWVVIVVAAIACALVVGVLLPRPLMRAPQKEPATTRILLLSNPIHTDLAIPLTPAVRARFALLGGAGVPLTAPEAQWLIVGWGGRAFYLETPTWSELKAMPVLKALTVDRSVMHIDVAGEIALPHPAVTPLVVSDAGLERLLDFIDASFDRAGGLPIAIPGRSYGPSDRFFEAHGRFNALLGCNTWTAAALRQAGLTTGWWNPLPESLALSLRVHEQDRL